jgi:hypothetical protein
MHGSKRLELPLRALRIRQFATYNLCFGELAEWSIAPVLKTGSPQGLQGSNPWLSANRACLVREWCVTRAPIIKCSRMRRTEWRHP